MHHAAQAADAAEREDRFLHRAPRMKDDRQVEVTGERKLAIEVKSLGRWVEPLDEVIQAAFADGAGPFARDPVAQCAQVAGLVALQVHRVQAIGRVQTRMHGAGIAQSRPAVVVHGGHELGDDARGQGAVQHGVAIGGEFRRVEVAMAVEQSHRSGCGIAWLQASGAGRDRALFPR